MNDLLMLLEDLDAFIKAKDSENINQISQLLEGFLLLALKALERLL